MTPANIEKFYKRLSKAEPRPQTELNYTNAYTLLVAVILSAQATDRGVNKATASLFSRVQTPKEMLALGEDGLRHYVRSIGLFNSKARNIIATSRLLVERHANSIPCDRESLESLPGVGRKTANVVLNIAFDRPTIAVDTHIFRVANRSGIARGKNVRIVEEALEQCTPGKFRKNAHQWLILHGRYVCTARKPRCHSCYLFDLCEWEDKHQRDTESTSKKRDTSDQ